MFFPAQKIPAPRPISWSSFVAPSLTVYAQCSLFTDGRIDRDRSRSNRRYSFGVSPKTHKNSPNGDNAAQSVHACRQFVSVEKYEKVYFLLGLQIDSLFTYLKSAITCMTISQLFLSKFRSIIKIISTLQSLDRVLSIDCVCCTFMNLNQYPETNYDEPTSIATRVSETRRQQSVWLLLLSTQSILSSSVANSLFSSPISFDRTDCSIAYTCSGQSRCAACAHDQG